MEKDNLNEIVTTTGYVLLFDGKKTTVKWQFDNISSGEDHSNTICLADIDNDGMQEIIRAESWNKIDVFDADTKSLKYSLPTDEDINALYVTDYNKDGIYEILYGDGQWGSIHCINSQTKTELWSIKNPDSGVTSITIAYVENNDSLKVIWGSGCNSTGDEKLYIADINSQKIQYASLDIDGPFYAISVGDVDNDGENEIVAISHQSGDDYYGGIVSIFNAKTHELKWQTGEYFFGFTGGYIYNCVISDIDNDGVNEIVVASGEVAGTIYVIDGNNDSMKTYHEYSYENINPFSALAIDDVDNDGKKEIIAGTRENTYVIDPSDFSIKWASPVLSNSYYPVTVKTGIIDKKPGKAIVICQGFIYVFNGLTHDTWHSVDSNYTNFDLYDINGDGLKEIIASTDDGYLRIIDGSSHQVIKSFRVSSQQIDGIAVSDINNDGIPVFVFTSNGRVYFYLNNSQYMVTQNYPAPAGAYNGLQVVDANGDGKKEIYVGTNTNILELTSVCYNCTWFTSTVREKDKSCHLTPDGYIKFKLNNGLPPYSFSWNNGNSQSSDSLISGLAPGTYIITVTDNQGCLLRDSSVIRQSILLTTDTSINESCIQGNDGSAQINIIKGTSAFTFNWSNGDAAQYITGLSSGLYSVTITDANNCLSIDTIRIRKDTVILRYYSENIQCFGDNNGWIELYSSGGSPPYNYIRNIYSTYSYLNDLNAGTYSVTVTDNIGCSAKQQFSIYQPPELKFQVTTVDDNPNTPYGDGGAYC